jgi:hypothetical protein
MKREMIIYDKNYKYLNDVIKYLTIRQSLKMSGMINHEEEMLVG